MEGGQGCGRNSPPPAGECAAAAASKANHRPRPLAHSGGRRRAVQPRRALSRTVASPTQPAPKAERQVKRRSRGHISALFSFFAPLLPVATSAFPISPHTFQREGDSQCIGL